MPWESVALKAKASKQSAKREKKQIQPNSRLCKQLLYHLSDRIRRFFMDSVNQQGATAQASPRERLGRPTHTTWDAIAQSLAIGPVFSSAFVGFLIAGAAGGATTLSTLIGAIGVLAVGWVITLYARRYAGAGAIYEYLRHSTPALGLSAAGIYFLGCLVLDT